MIEYRKVNLADSSVTVINKNDSLYISSTQRLLPYPSQIGYYLTCWANVYPTRCFIADKMDRKNWRQLTYKEAESAVASVSQFIFNRTGGSRRPLMVISQNSIEGAVMTLAAMQIGCPVIPIRPDLVGSIDGILWIEDIVCRTRPYVLFIAVARRDIVVRLRALVPELVIVTREVSGVAADVVQYADILQFAATRAMVGRVAEIVPDDTAKIMFTSGSTGKPKGVINTHGMLSAQQQMIAQLWKFVEDKPPILLDWLPWHHTSGGNHSFNMVLRNGGTLYVDNGSPTSDGIHRTLANMREVQPTWYTNVPLGYSMLLPTLETDDGLARAFFEHLDMLVYGGAAISRSVWDRMDALAVRATGKRCYWASGWGLTETASTSTVTHFPTPRGGIIGLPLPGMTLKLTPHREVFSIGVKGPNVTPGYFGDPVLTQEAFDDEGYFVTGDLVGYANGRDLSMGLSFEGRFKEEFKLSTGDWVASARIRDRILETVGPILQDVVVAGQDRDYLTVFLWLNVQVADSMFRKSRGSTNAEREGFIADRLAEYNSVIGSASEMIKYFQVVAAPRIESGEVTAKGSINREVFLKNRGKDLASLYDGIGMGQWVAVP